MPNDIPHGDGRTRAIRSRDRNRCQNCFRTDAEVSQLEVHRIVPKQRGGTDRISNLTLLCDECHQAVHKYRVQGVN